MAQLGSAVRHDMSCGSWFKEGRPCVGHSRIESGCVGAGVSHGAHAARVCHALLRRRRVRLLRLGRHERARVEGARAPRQPRAPHPTRVGCLRCLHAAVAQRARWPGVSAGSVEDVAQFLVVSCWRAALPRHACLTPHGSMRIPWLATKGLRPTWRVRWRRRRRRAHSRARCCRASGTRRRTRRRSCSASGTCRR